MSERDSMPPQSSPISETLGEIKDLEQEKKELEQPTGTEFEQKVVSLLLLNIKEMVDNAEDVEVRAIRGEQTTVFEVRVARSDLGQLIGKKGANAAAIRRLVWCWSAKHHKRAVVEIVE